MPKKITSTRGFASMTPEQRKAVARKGGLSVSPDNRAFSRDPRLASEAGKRRAALRKEGK
jgi:uncharacterized protein